jgi:predicted transcriptional regulator
MKEGLQVDINVKVKFESPEIMAALLAFAEAIPQTKLGTILQIKEGQVVEEKTLSYTSENRNVEAVIGEVKTSQVKNITLEEVRAKLALLSQKGKEKQVKELIRKFGANKLTEVSVDNYEALLKDAEGL